MMPTKRRVALFFIVLSWMLLAKYVWGQEEAVVGGDSISDAHADEALGYGLFAVIFGPLFGMMAGLKMAWSRHTAAKAGKYFDSELLRLEL